MANITVNTAEFNVARISKAGKTTYRGLLGIISSGNRAERDTATEKAVLALWSNATYRPLLAEVRRVFGDKAFDNVTKILGIDTEKPKKADVLVIFTAIVNGTADKVIKGEKLLYRGILLSLVKAEQARLAALEAEQAQQHKAVAA